ncbi:MAG TPA: hypothetical protein DCX91_15325 [Stenotrophomonas sp.]|nr:hypothetical protein [Stenotrophomonas sp.]
MEDVAYSCLPVTASLLLALIAPSSTLTIFRFNVALPTDTELLAAATEPDPSATAFDAAA